MTTLVMVFVAVATALVASAQQASCPGKGKDELEGASLVMRESHISKVSSITDDDNDMEEEDFDEDLTDEEGEEGSTCPKWCTKGRRLKNKPWSTKCWLWSCRGCSEYQSNCADILEGEPPVCGSRCSKSAERALAQGRSKALCRWPRCQTCDGWEKKCSAGALLMQEEHQDASVKTITRDLSETSEESTMEKDGDYDTEDDDIDDEMLVDGKEEETSTCPKWCTKGRRLKNKPWSTKCWLWSCRGCSEYQSNCADILEGEPPVCGSRCSKSAERALAQGRSKALCRWPRCQTCDGWEKKCSS